MVNGTYAVKKVSDLKPSKENPRKNLGDLSELVASIKAHGIVEPLLVTPEGVIICGHRRLEGAKKAGVVEVPVIVREMEEKVRIETMLVENLHREDLSPIEEAETYQRMIADLGYTQRTLAERVARSQSHISKRLALLTLPGDTQKAVDEGEMSVADGVELAKLPTPTLVSEAVKKANDLGRSIPAVVAATLAEKERVERVTAAEAKANKAGWKVVPQSQTYGTDVARLAEKDIAPHVKAKCHAVTITSMGRTDHLCLKKSSHGVPTKETPTDDKMAKAKAHERDLIQAKKARFEFERNIKRVPAGDRLEFLSFVLVNGAGAEASKNAARIAGLEFEEGKGKEALLKAFDTAKDTEAKARLALAAAIGMMETGFHASYGASSYAAPLLGFLESLGYTPTPAEKLEASGKAPRRPY